MNLKMIFGGILFGRSKLKFFLFAYFGFIFDGCYLLKLFDEILHLLMANVTYYEHQLGTKTK